MRDRCINLIKAKYQFLEKQQKLRVCAYVRVSTGNEKQQDSLKNQTEYFNAKIKKNPDYIHCGIYSDSGVSGNKVDRPGLNALLEKARAGKVDLIITKSISRFARNTVMLLQVVRELRELGVGILFEEQKIDTLSSQGEFMLTVLGAFAEEERKSVSSNIKWAVQKRFQSGKGMVDAKRLLGYDKDKNGEFLINEEQAAIVRRIYKMYLNGICANKIAQIFNEEKVHTYTNHPWASHRIIRIISNEKNKGDFLMQKTYVDEKGKEVINRGERPQYYMKDSHPAIISREDWEEAQKIREKRKIKVYPYTGMLKCPYCGAFLIRVLQQRRWVMWRCSTYLRQGKAVCKGARIAERHLEEITKSMSLNEPMVLLEVDHEKCSQKRTKEDYSFIPASKYYD